MTNELVGKRVILTIQNPELQDFQLRPRVEIFDEKTISIVTKVVGIDEFGVWIEHDGYPWRDPETNKLEHYKAHILVRYESITSITYFPDLPAEEGSFRIGFVVRERE